MYYLDGFKGDAAEQLTCSCHYINVHLPRVGSVKFFANTSLCRDQIVILRFSKMCICLILFVFMFLIKFFIALDDKKTRLFRILLW